MQNFFKNNNSNPFAAQQSQPRQLLNKKDGKRLNIVDMEVINSTGNADIEYMEIRMNNLYNLIHKKSETIDPITIESMKIEWETLRDKVYKERQKLLIEEKTFTKNQTFIKNLANNIKKVITIFKLYNPKIKQILANFNEINMEVENLVKHSTPVGEEEKKYGILVNKINQATKLNYKLSNEIK